MRKPFVLIVLTIIFLYAALFAGVRGIQKADIGKVPVAAQQSIKQQPNYGKTPLYFIPNKGQVNQKALFYAKAKRYTLWMTHEGLVFDSSRAVAGQGDTTDRASANFQPLKKTAPSPTFERDVSRLFFLGANKSPQIVPVTETEHKVNYFIGNDKSKWQADIATSKAVLYREVYKGIDLKVYGIEKQIEYDWIVKPGAQVDTIAFQYENVKGTAIDEGGNLVVTTEFGDLVHKRPISFQVIDGEKKSVNVVFKKIKENAYGFEAEAYDTDVELIIDPLVTVYSTYLGGDDSGVYSQDKASGLDVDANGCVYVLGHTAAPDFPVSNAFQGNISHPEYKQSDITITKFSPDGSSLIYSTYLGGGQTEQSGDIAIDSNNCAYLTGNTTSVDFPVRFPLQYPKSESWDIFVTKLSAAGDELIYSTYLGRSGLDYGKEIEVDENGRAYIAGETTSTTFPVSVNGYSNTMNGTEDIILIVMSSTGQSILYSTFLGSDGHNDKLGGMTLDSSNSIYLTGYTDSTTFPVTENAYQNKNAGGLYDAFVSKINSTCTQLLYSTYLGGTDTEFCNDIAVDNNGAIYITGSTQSEDFPTVNAYRDWPTYTLRLDCFVTKFSPDGSSLEYSTFIGGSDTDGANSIAVDGYGSAVIVGSTKSIDFPQFPYERIPKNKREGIDSFPDDVQAFVTKFHPQGSSLLFSKVIAGNDYINAIKVSVDDNHGIYVIGQTQSSDFPTYNAFQPQYAGGYTDMFVTKYYYPDPFPLLTLTAPNGGESWKVGSQQNITWTSTGLDGQRVRLLLYKGGTQVGLIADNLPISPGNFSWNVGEYEGGTAGHGEDYQIRIETANGDYHDTSASYFKISNPSITVTAPNGGQTFQAGDTNTVTWDHVGAIGLVDIDLSTNNGTTWQEVEHGVLNTNSYTWTVTNVHSDQCLIRVKDNSSTIRDTSDAVFTIIGLPEITLTAPNGGEILTAGFSEMITWTSQNVTGTITIDLYKAGVFYVSLGSADVAGGSIELGIPLDVTWGTDFTIRIHQGSVEDFSDAPVICRHHYVFHGKDFIGDNAEEFAIYRPSTGRWCINGTPSVAWGVATDVPVPGNYDTDDKTDIAIYRPSTGRWCVLGQASIAYGTRTDIPVPGDYDGDGKTDIAIYRPSTGRFSVLNQNSVPVGPPESIPVPADYDGDGDTDFAVFTPSTGYWTIHGQENVRFGIATDIPVPADYDGDGKAEIAVFRPSTGRWCIMGQPSIPWGTSTDIPVPGDYDGDGDDDIAIFRPSNGQWSVLGSTSVLYGSPGDIPLVTHNR